MTTIESLLQELEQEAQTTRRVLERVPEDRLAWKPHDKSMSLGQLALHVATTPGFVAEFSQQSPFQMAKFTQPSATSAAELMRALDESIGKARKILRGMDDAALGKTWRVVDGEREMMAMPSRRSDAHDHAEPLVSPPGATLCLPPASGREGAVHIRPER